MSPSLKLATALLIAATPALPGLAQEYIYGPLPQVETHKTTLIEVNQPAPASTSSTEIIADQKGVQFDFKERLNNLQAQIDNGLQKGWLKVGQAAAFSTERSRLMSATNDVQSAGWPKGQTDQLEKDITAFSASVTTQYE